MIREVEGRVVANSMYALFSLRSCANQPGRDDRVISDHGREARFPFLDEALVSYLNALPVWLKADMRYPRGTGMYQCV